MKRILIASVLKPINDPRAYAKLALSLRETNKYHLNIIGFFAKNTPKESNPVFTSIFSKHRLHYSRWLAPFGFLKHVKSYKPDLVVVTTFELLPFAVWAKKRYGFKLIYDVQENYALNAGTHKTLPLNLGQLAAKAITYIESKAAGYVDHFLLAEKCYQEELGFLHNYTVLENKYAGEVTQTAPYKLDLTKPFEFLISGTLAEVYGIEAAVNWFKIIQQKWPHARLHILGHITTKSFGKRLQLLIQDNPQIRLTGSSTPLPYPQIQAAVKMADIILLPYQQTTSIRYKIPTKLFESLALAKPIIHSPNQLWEQLTAEFTAGLGLDFEDLDNAAVNFEAFSNNTFYQKQPDISLTWASESTKWTALVDKLIP
jgi:hypothetical protein